jgi:diguanylate cyclase (GGDEF)-like protein
MDPLRVPASEKSMPFVRPTRIGVVGGDSRAALLLGMLHGIGGVTVVSLLTGDASDPAARTADELGIPVTRDKSAFASESDMDLVIDASDGDSHLQDAIRALDSSAEILGSAASQLLLDLFATRRLSEEQQRLSGELEQALDLSRSQERRLAESKTVLESANEELQAQLSEIFFAHEFFKVLTRCTAVDDVCSLVVDGLNGLLGSEISCVYLANSEDRTLRLRANQGRSHDVFAEVVSAGDTILGSAYADGPVQESELSDGAASATWIDSAVKVRSQAAVPLQAGDDVVGVLVMASTTDRQLSNVEMDRFIALGNQASLSLQNALLLGELERLSVTDRLTQLYDAEHFYERLDEEFSRSSRFGHHLSLIMLDVDDLESLNEGHGQSSGDEFLRGASSVIRSSLREMDVAARYGGEEFAVLLPETSAQGALKVAERIRAGVESYAVLIDGASALSRTVSAGIATYPEQAATAPRLVEAALEALASAKKAGKNLVRIFEG